MKKTIFTLLLCCIIFFISNDSYNVSTNSNTAIEELINTQADVDGAIFNQDLSDAVNEFDMENDSLYDPGFTE